MKDYKNDQSLIIAFSFHNTLIGYNQSFLMFKIRKLTKKTQLLYLAHGTHGHTFDAELLR